MSPTEIAHLAAAIDRDRVERARRELPGAKLLAGEELFHWACGWSQNGIRAQHPAWTDAEVLTELKRRLALQDRLERRHVG